MDEPGALGVGETSSPTGSEDISEDSLLGGRVRLRQLRRGHRVGTDAILLAAAVQPGAGETVADIGAGTGAVGLMVAVRARETTVVLVENDPVLLDLCRTNAGLNGMKERARVVAADVLAPAEERRRAGLLPSSADWVATNPPYLDPARSRRSPDPRRAAAHALLAPDGLERWLKTCADLLKPKGSLALIHRADALGACLAHLRRGFGGLRLRFVHPRQDAPAIRVVVTAVKGGRAPLAVAPPLVLHEPGGGFTPEAEALHRGEASLF